MTRSTRSAIAISLLMGGCFGTETGNPPSVALGLTARSSDLSVASLEPEATGTRVERAWIALADVRAIEGLACDHVASSAAVDLAVVDAITNEALGGVPAGDSCGVRATLVPVADPPSGAPLSLEGRSILVTGVLADGRPFEIASASQPHVLVQGTPFRTREGDALLIAVDVATWLRGLDLAALATEPDGVVRVGPSGPAAARDAFEANLAAGLAIFADADGDGALDAAEESAGPLATGHLGP